MPDDTNRRVAEQVIGWKFLDVTPESCAALGHVGSYREGIHGPCWFCQKCRPIPDYLHDPAAVFGPGGVVEKMQERGYSLRLGVYADAVVAGGAAMACFAPPGRGWCDETEFEGKELAEAVCIAALAALER